MKPLNSVLALGALALVIAGGFHYWPESSEPAAMQAPNGSTPSRAAATSAAEPTQSGDHRVVELAVKYLELYGDTITEPATQARLYNERRNLLARYPDSGDELFQSAITTAFPELADSIFALLAKLDLYNRWLDNHELRLQGLPDMERYAELWQQREAIFGPLASQIWAEEQNPVEAKSDHFQQTLARLDQANQMPPGSAPRPRSGPRSRTRWHLVGLVQPRQSLLEMVRFGFHRVLLLGPDLACQGAENRFALLPELGVAFHVRQPL